MKVYDLFGRMITNIYLLSGISDGWLDTASVTYELDNEIHIQLPYGYYGGDWHCKLNADGRSLFADLSDIPIYNIPEGTLSYMENGLKYLQNQRVVDYWWVDDGDDKGFLELENGYFVSDQDMAPSGTGKAGLQYYGTLDELKRAKGPLIRYSEVKDQLTDDDD